MPELAGGLPWSQPGWFDAAATWTLARLHEQTIAPTGAIELVQERPWSAVLRVPSDEGDLYFKATAPALAHEPGLTRALSAWRPDCTPAVIAIDPARGWMLMHDAGVPLRGLVNGRPDLQHWRVVLPSYAELQIEMAGRRDELLALGALDRRLAGLPARYEALLSDTDALLIDRPNGLTRDQLQRLRALIPRFAALCDALAHSPAPETLHHDDFHDGNIFVRDGCYTFADWGESCVAHPFFTMVVTLRSIGHRLRLPADSPELSDLRDLYLAPWERYDSRTNLLMAFERARRVGMVCRALTWHLVISALDEPFRSKHAGAVPGWLQVFLEAETAAT